MWRSVNPERVARAEIPREAVVRLGFPDPTSGTGRVRLQDRYRLLCKEGAHCSPLTALPVLPPG